MQFQSQNAIAFGQPKRRIQVVDGQTQYDDNTVAKERYALELQASMTTWFRGRVGIEFEKSRFDDVTSPALATAFDNLELSNAALEGVVIVIPPKDGRIGLGALGEYERGLTEKLDLFSVGPIITYASGPWSAIANLLIIQHLRSDDRKRDFAYAAQLQYTISPAWSVALEGYGTIDRIGSSGRKSQELEGFPDFDQHRLGPVVYYRWGSALTALSPMASPKDGAKSANPRAKGLNGDDRDGADGEPISLGVGLLFGLNGNTPDRALKVSLEVDF